jgi:hypothetical protein
MPVIPASVSIVTTVSLWLKSGFGLGGAYARTRVIFIFGRGAKARITFAEPRAAVAAMLRRNVLLFIEEILLAYRI